jgi:hypothetical protein
MERRSPRYFNGDHNPAFITDPQRPKAQKARAKSGEVFGANVLRREFLAESLEKFDRLQIVDREEVGDARAFGDFLRRQVVIVAAIEKPARLARIHLVGD